MNKQSLQPIIEKLESLFSKFNEKFYNNELQTPVITVSPDTTKGAYGWCTAWKAWSIALIALFYAAVAAVNHFAGTTVSATGIICGAFMVALAFIGNIFVALWNLVVEMGERHERVESI